MDLNDAFLAKVIYDDMRGMDRVIDQELKKQAAEKEKSRREAEHRMRTKKLLAERDLEHQQQISIIKDENERLYAELEIMRQVVAQKNSILQNAKENLESFHKLSIVLQENLDKEKKEKEVIKNMLLNANLLEIAEINGTIKSEMAEERALLHKWMLSRNSFWELAYRLSKDYGLDLSMDELKEKAKTIQDELLADGFSAPDYKEQWDENTKHLIEPEVQKDIIEQEIAENAELRQLNEELSLEEKLEIIRIDREMNLLKQGIDPDASLKDQIKPSRK